MSSAPPLMAPQQPVIMKLTCTQCQGDMLVKMPTMHLFNQIDVSCVVFQHAKVDKCPKCGKAYVCLLAGIDDTGRIQLAWTPVETQQAASPIVPPTPQNMDIAKRMQELSEAYKAQDAAANGKIKLV